MPTGLGTGRTMAVDASHRGRVLALLAIATAIGAAGLAAGGTAGALLGARLGGPGMAGVPVGLLVIGSVGGALFISRFTREGRRGRGLMYGYLLGAGGALLVIAAATARNLPLLLAGSVVLGTANSAIFLTRYAAREAGEDKGRGRALGAVFFATAIGAAVSPILLGPSGTLARSLGLPSLSGLYLVAVVTFGAAALILAAVSNPRVPWAGVGASVLSSGNVTRPATRVELVRTWSDRRVRTAIAALGVSNFIMVGIMAVAPVEMMARGQGLEATGVVIALHVAGMFAPSPLAGYLADRFSPGRVVLIGWMFSLAACGAGMFVNENSSLAMASHLLFVGVGWNFGVVGGSALLASSVPDALRPHAEGIGEVVLGVAAAVAAPTDSVIAAAYGYGAVLLLSVTLALTAVLTMAATGRKADLR